MSENIMEKLIALCKRRGFMYPGSELYGGLANTYDYGPMGTELLRNIKSAWWKTFVYGRDDMVGLDASLISHHQIWEASGHVASFADAMIDCKNCRIRIRADHLIEDYFADLDKNSGVAIHKLRVTLEKWGTEAFGSIKLSQDEVKQLINALKMKKIEGLSNNQMDFIIHNLNIPCPNCKENKGDKWTSVRKFNQLFPVQLGLVEGDEGSAYLRGETAQGIFINFKNIVSSNRVKLPFGVAQQGKSFRNEITPGNSIFRTIEFEQGEIEYFFDPKKTSWEPLFDEWKNAMWDFVTTTLNVSKENLHWRVHTDQERSFYSKKTEDLEYNFPFGFKELWGLAYRTDYDLMQHQNVSKKDLSITDSETGEKIIPHVIEPAVGINRLMLMVLCDAYDEDSDRVVLKLSPVLAPVKVAVFPLLRNKQELVSSAQKLHRELKKHIDGVVQYDDRGNIGKRYLAQDEIGTPFCVTIDFQTLEDKTVTVRARDTMEQQRVGIVELASYLKQHFS